jgi:UDP-N-acetylglucosamine 2-epimerase
VLIAHADDHAALCCALAAARLGLSIVRVGAEPRDGPGRVIARLADLLLTRSPRDFDAAARTAPERVTVIGNPVVDVVLRQARAALDAAAWRRHDVNPGAYVLAILANVPSASVASALTAIAAGDDLLVDAPPGCEVPGARALQHPSALERLSLARTARAIVTDSPRVQEEAAVLGVPCYAVDAALAALDVIAAPAQDAPRMSASWDRGAVERAVDALVANFAVVRLMA